MGKSKSLELPAAPTYKENANLSPNITFGSDYFKQLLSGDFTGNQSWLAPLTNTNTSKDALSYAQGVLQPQFRDTLQQISNNAAANGQLNSSTFTDALARSQSDLNSQYQSIVSQGAINDAYQNNANRLNLLQQGSGGLQGFTGLAQNQTNQENGFNLENYQNLVAKAIQDNQNANKANGFQQVLGMVSPIGHDYLQSQGINSVPGYGVADIAKIGSMFMPFAGGGAMNQSTALKSGASASTPGFYASNSMSSSGPFSGADSDIFSGMKNGTIRSGSNGWI